MQKTLASTVASLTQGMLHETAHKKEARGKRDGSLVHTIGANEAEYEDGKQKSAIQQDSVQVGQLFTEAAAVEK